MKIDRISMYQLDLPLRKPYQLSGGRLQFEQLDSTIVRIDTDEGITGWGEACPWGATYLPAHGRGVRAAIHEIAPRLLDRDPTHLDEINRVMDLALPGHLYAKSALDVACWDILGTFAGLPISGLLGACFPDPVPLASSISTGSPEQMVREIERFRELGYRVHSCKVGADIAQDIARIELLAEHELPDETIFYDANRAWLPREAITVLSAIPPTTSWFEQPCESLAEIAHVRRNVSQPLGVDESLHTIDDLLRIHSEGIAEVVNIKINRVGGLTKARRLRDLCLATGITMLVMDTGGTVIADTAVAHLAQSIPAPSCLGVWSCQDMITVDPAPEAGVRNVDGAFTAPATVGLGVAPNLDILGPPIAAFLTTDGGRSAS